MRFLIMRLNMSVLYHSAWSICLPGSSIIVLCSHLNGCSAHSVHLASFCNQTALEHVEHVSIWRLKSSGWQYIAYGTRSILNATLCLFGLFLADSVKGVWGLWSRNIWIMQQGLALWTLIHQTPKGSISKSCENILLNSKSLSVWLFLNNYRGCLSITDVSTYIIYVM